MKLNNVIIPGFFVLEGIDGSGTSTQAQYIAQRLEKLDIPAFITQEPTDSSIGLLIRKILASAINVMPLTLAQLFQADRNEHIFGRGGIVEAQRAGEVILSDRYLFSSLAYQGLDCGLDAVWELNKHFPFPEMLFFLDISVDLAEERIADRGQLDFYETKQLQKRILENYNAVFSDMQQSGCATRIHRVDAERGIEEIFAEIWGILSTSPIIKHGLASNS